MLRIRNRKGQYIEFSTNNEPAIIEIQDSEGSVGMVFVVKSPNHIKQILPGTSDADSYAKAFKVNFCKKLTTLP